MAQDKTEQNKVDRSARLRAALRDNLKKRKMQDRELGQDAAPGAEKPGKD